VKRPLTAALVASLALASVALADNWPQWRGPKGDGHSAEKNLPTEWGADRNVAWKFKLPGPGESSPVVWGDRTFLTATAGDDVVLLCVGTDGKEKWRQTMSNTGKDRNGPDKATDASASCSTDGKHVWSYVGGQKAGRLTCHDVDGKLVWEKNLQDYGKFNIQFGTHWTPALHKGRLYLQVMHKNVQKLVCLEAATGKEVWGVDRPGYVKVPSAARTESPDVYASAFVWEGEGGPLLVAHGNDYTTGHRLENGEEVWRVQGLNPTSNGAWRFVSNPMLSPDLIVVPSCKNGPTVAFNPVGAKGDIAPGNKAELWRLPQTAERTTPDVVTPLRVGDVIYICQDGPFIARDAKTGQLLYREQVSKGLHRASMVHADGKIYVVSTTGAVDVVQPGRTFKKLATNTVPDKLYGSPAVADGRIYLRGYEYLWAVGSK
jgi:outer membrane protein assembly factor BamB